MPELSEQSLRPIPSICCELFVRACGEAGKQADNDKPAVAEHVMAVLLWRGKLVRARTGCFTSTLRLLWQLRSGYETGNYAKQEQACDYCAGDCCYCEVQTGSAMCVIIAKA